MVDTAWVVPSAKALGNPNTRDRVIVGDKDSDHPATPEMPDGGEVVISANADQLPTLVALNGPIQEKIAAGMLAIIPEGDALSRREILIRNKHIRRNQVIAVQENWLGQAKPASPEEINARVESLVDPGESPTRESGNVATDKRPTVAEMQDRIRSAGSHEDLDAIAGEEANYPGGPRKGVMDALDRQRGVMQPTAASGGTPTGPVQNSSTPSTGL